MLYVIYLKMAHKVTNDQKNICYTHTHEKHGSYTAEESILHYKTDSVWQQLLPTGNSKVMSYFWTSNRRQYGVIFIVSLASFLQGASVGTSAISIPRMPTTSNESTIDNASWPYDFVVTDQDAFWIS